MIQISIQYMTSKFKNPNNNMNKNLYDSYTKAKLFHSIAPKFDIFSYTGHTEFKTKYKERQP